MCFKCDVIPLCVIGPEKNNDTCNSSNINSLRFTIYTIVVYDLYYTSILIQFNI